MYTLYHFSIDKYEIPLSNISLGHRLGQGGYGTVHLSEWNGTLVAVKKVPVLQDVDMEEIRILRYILTSYRQISLLLLIH